MVLFFGPIIFVRPPPFAGTVTAPDAAAAGLTFVKDKAVLKEHDEGVTIQRLSEHIATDFSDQDKMALAMAKYEVGERQDMGFNRGFCVGFFLFVVYEAIQFNRHMKLFLPKGVYSTKAAWERATDRAYESMPKSTRLQELGTISKLVGAPLTGGYIGSKIEFSNGRTAIQKDLNLTKPDTMDKFRQAWDKTVDDLKSALPPNEYLYLETGSEAPRRNFEKLMDKEKRRW